MIQIPDSSQAPVPLPETEKPKNNIPSKKKKNKLPKEAREPMARYIVFGLLGSAVLASFGLISSRYYVFTPLPLTIGVSAWIIKTVDRKNQWKKTQVT